MTPSTTPHGLDHLLTAASGRRLRWAVLLIGLLLMSRDLTARFTGKHEFNSAMYSLFARNHLRYGLGYTRLFCTWGQTPDPPRETDHYLNHPPLIGLWAAAPMAVLGEREWALRAVPVAATLGSAWLLMVIFSRIGSPALGILSGLFFVTLPVVAYFGRMLDHVPLVQFFSLLMLHGYLQWTGVYGPGCGRRKGAVLWLAGTVLGIGTGWATVILAGLIAALHLTHRRRPLGITLAVLLVPGGTLAAVLLHILWGMDWNTQALLDLMRARSVAAPADPRSWWRTQWSFALGNFTWAGVGAALVYLVAVITARSRRSAGRIEAALGGPWAQSVSLMMLLHGALYVLAFRPPAMIHEYWQFFAAPFVATAMASVILLSYLWLTPRSPRAAALTAGILLSIPLPGFMLARDRYYREVQMPQRYIDAVLKARDLTPPDAAVMTSRDWYGLSEQRGGRLYRWGVAQILYYAERPLIHAEMFDEQLARRENCAVYVLELLDTPEVEHAAEALSRRYRVAPVESHHLVVLLREPRG